MLAKPRALLRPLLLELPLLPFALLEADIDPLTPRPGSLITSRWRSRSDPAFPPNPRSSLPALFAITAPSRKERGADTESPHGLDAMPAPIPSRSPAPLAELLLSS